MPKPITDLVQIDRLGTKKLAENERFRKHLKRHNFSDLRFRRIAEEIEDQVDCRACGNFPHLERGSGSIESRMWQMIDRATYCPIVYNSLEAYKDLVNFQRG